MLGYHVHEKAIMTPLLLLTLVIYKNPTYKKLYPQFSLMAHISLCPLIPTSPASSLLKHTLVFLHFTFTAYATSTPPTSHLLPFLFGALSLSIFSDVIHPLVSKGRMEFLPLMMYSVVGTFFNLYFWFKLYFAFFIQDNRKEKNASKRNSKKKKS